MKQTVIKEVREYCRVKGIRVSKKIRYADYSRWIHDQHRLYKQMIGRSEWYAPSLDKDREEYRRGFYGFLENIPTETKQED